MAKGKARNRGKQVSRETMAQARYAQKNGLLSSRAKVEGSRLSRKVVERLGRLGNLKALPSYEPNAKTGRLNVTKQPLRVGAKLGKGRKRDYEHSNFEIVNGLAIIKREDKRFLDALNRPRGSPAAGVRKLPGAVDSGYQHVVQLDTAGIHNFRDLFRALKKGRLNSFAKRPDEQWGFTVWGGLTDNSRENVFQLTGRSTGLRTDAELLAYLERYKFIEEAAADPDDEESNEAFDSFELYAMPPGEFSGDTPKEALDLFRKRRKRLAQQEAKRNPKVAKIKERSKEAAVASYERHKETSKKGMVAYRIRKRAAMGEDAYKAEQNAKRKARAAVAKARRNAD